MHKTNNTNRWFQWALVLILALAACTTVGPPPAGSGPTTSGGGGGTDSDPGPAADPEADPEADPVADPEATDTEEASVPGTSGSDEPDNVKVVILPFLSFAPFYIAIEEGYFADYGIEVELVNLFQQQEILPALASGQVDVSSGLMSAGLINAIAGGGQMRVVANKGYVAADSCSSIALIASASFLAENDPNDPESLRGQEIDVVRSTWIEYYLDELLQTVGLGLDDIVEVDIPSTSEIEAMNSGELVLTTQNEPWVTRMIDAGHTPILDPASMVVPDSESAVMIYGPTLLADPDLGSRFMAAYLLGVQQYQEGKTERNIEILSEALSLDADLLQAMCWQDIRTDGSVNTASVLEFQDWAIGRGYVETGLPIEQIWDPSFSEDALNLLGSQE